MSEHLSAEDYRNRAERAEQEAAELREALGQMAEAANLFCDHMRRDTFGKDDNASEVYEAFVAAMAVHILHMIR